MNCPERGTLSDYALALLPAAEQQQVASHLVTCAACRDWVRDERTLAQHVRHTIAAAPLPPPARIQSLMPGPPQRRVRAQIPLLRPVAALGVLVILFLGSLQLQLPAAGQSLPTASATTLSATATQVPGTKLTATAAQEHAALDAVPLPIAALAPAITPPRPPELP